MSASAIPPAALAEAAAAVRGFLRIDGASEAAVLERLSLTAIEAVEAFLRQSLIRRGHEDTLPASATWTRLAAAPVASIGAVAAVASGGAESALPVGAFAVDIDAGGHGWVRVTAPGGASRVLVRYEAGLAATWGALPAPVAQGVVALAAHLFDDRSGAAQPPAAVTALLRPWRRMTLEAGR